MSTSDIHSEETSPLEDQTPAKNTVYCWLTMLDGHRRISLPVTGELIVGRFDEHVKGPLDVDFTFENRENPTVSRRHAHIIGVKGYHTIEDLGSSNGVSINGLRVAPKTGHPLQLGDEIAFGELKVRYNLVPDRFMEADPTKLASADHFLYFNFSGRKIQIEPSKNFVIGRPDPSASFKPHIDLSQDWDVVVYVSRRHASITWSNNIPYLTDLGSTSGTRLNGQVLMPNRAFPLKPGDHMSLGGCVLAYDVEF